MSVDGGQLQLAEKNPVGLIICPIFGVQIIYKKRCHFFLRAPLPFKQLPADWPRDGASNPVKSKRGEPLLWPLDLSE